MANSTNAHSHFRGKKCTDPNKLDQDHLIQLFDQGYQGEHDQCWVVEKTTTARKTCGKYINNLFIIYY